MPQRWSKEIVVRHILKRHRRGQKLNSRFVQLHVWPLSNAARRYFGSWKKAIAASGLDYDQIVKYRTWSRKTLIEEIQDRVKQGRSIAITKVQEEDGVLVQIATRFFGKQGWAKARVAAGFPPKDIPKHKKWDEQKICDAILRLRKSGAKLNSSAMQRHHRRLFDAAVYVFGAWEAALLGSGLVPSSIRLRSRWTKEEVLVRIKQLEKKRVRLNPQNMIDFHQDLFKAGIRYFGSWDKAVEAAGVSYRLHWRKWSTKIWLRKMKEGEYKELLERAEIHAKRHGRRK